VPNREATTLLAIIYQKVLSDTLNKSDSCTALTDNELEEENLDFESLTISD